jgi:hypothetical protein
VELLLVANMSDLIQSYILKPNVLKALYAGNLVSKKYRTMLRTAANTLVAAMAHEVKAELAYPQCRQPTDKVIHSAFYHFSFKGAFMMRKLTKRSRSTNAAIAALPAGDAWHHDIMAYLGYINVGYAVLAGLRLRGLSQTNGPTSATKDLDILAMTVLAIANGSQAWGNFVRSRGSGRWIMGEGLDRITVLDAAFLVLDALAAWAFAARG